MRKDGHVTPHHVLVTGGAGFIGSHAVAALIEHGARVRALDDLSTGLRSNLPATAELIEGSVADPSALAAALDGVDAVVHLAAIASVARSIEDPVGTHGVNLAGTVALAAAAATAGVTRIVYASSAAVYGAAERPAHGEADAPDPVTPYAIDKLAGEWYLRHAASEHGLDATALRFFNVYGPRQRADSPYAGVIARFASAMLAGEGLTVFGDGGQTRDFIAVRDVAAIVVHALTDAPSPGRYRLMNVCNGASVSLLDLIDALSAVTGAHPSVQHEPPRAGDLRHSRGDPTQLEAWFPERPRTELREGLAEAANAIVRS